MHRNCLKYPAEFVEDAFGESDALAKTLADLAVDGRQPRVLIVADSNVVQYTEGLGARIGRYVKKHGIVLAGSPVVMNAGERIKDDGFQSVMGVASAIMAAKIGHDDVVLAIGGGTLLDVVGYAAAQTRGGVRVVRMPTTPAAMLDAAFADYAAVNSATVKDALRVRSVPAAVIADGAFARTVLDGVWRAGFGEAVRLALAYDAGALETLQGLAARNHDRDAGAMDETLRLAWAIRRKKGATALGLWAAMRLQAMSEGYKLPYGYAVAIGVCIELACAVERGVVSEEERARVEGILRAGGALDGISFSLHLLRDEDNLLYGIDAWNLAAEARGIEVVRVLGKTELVAEVDREVYRAALKKIVSSATER